MVVHFIDQAKPFASSDAVTQRRQHALTPHCGFYPCPVSALGLCALCSLLRHYRRLAFALPLRIAHASTFLPPVPRRCFTFSAWRGSSTLRYMKALTPAPLTYGAGLPAYFATPSCGSISNHVNCLVIAFHHASVTSDFRTSPWHRRLAAALRRIEFVILRTDTSPPVAPHLASRRRSYLRLRSCGFLRHGLYRADVAPSRARCPLARA